MPELPATLTIPEHLSGQRLDVVLAEMLPAYSRSSLQQWIQQGQILLDGEQVKPKVKVYADQQCQLDIEPVERNEHCQPQPIALDIVYQDAALIVINKPAGFVVHPAAGHASGTLQNALLYYDESLGTLPRAGIVHRLDRDTTGLMVVARSLTAHKSLVDQLQARTVQREYQAIVHGVMTGGGRVDAAIGRHAKDRKRMAVRADGKPAVTHYRLLKRFRAHSHVHLKLESGRTHQIRVHMQHIRYPIVGDPVYGGRDRIPAKADEALISALKNFRRQALHAWQLSLQHPQTQQHMHWQAPVPDDMQQLLAVMQQDLDQHEA